eukprot:CAMPEP_0175067762 /NCGR_PEP_ID=MMETSP0052_2-20121109/17284_2 /TAXON_ID=51329 ORGANISM="Polytomella parva, Strain SAG 63-3" /NCGR_SAMPLE_ID=MMETSP0052_2 /ASSEMBLY_ACC=CAM_ASM_000194 /LENGTH=105 /DNA_ID=CAMNT_0016334691 /DNA_START=467 /DNA_END=784 /DNA_ORIENTATION=-
MGHCVSGSRVWAEEEGRVRRKGDLERVLDSHRCRVLPWVMDQTVPELPRRLDLGAVRGMAKEWFLAGRLSSPPIPLLRRRTLLGPKTQGGVEAAAGDEEAAIASA